MGKKVVIIGAGPAGLFAAYKLSCSAQSNQFEIKLIDKGKDVNERTCPLNSNSTIECAKCSPCKITHGIGGAGLMSDGKLLFDPRIGSNLDEIVPQSEHARLFKEVEDIFSSYGIKITSEQEEKVKALEKSAMQSGLEFIYQRQAHIGSENLKPLIAKFKSDLEAKGVSFECTHEIEELSELDADFVIIAPGRVGGSSGWFEKILQQNNIQFSYRPVDIGVRIEVPSIITSSITNITRDMKFYAITKSYQDRVRTFCTCPNGYVTKETHEGFNIANGHAESRASTDKTNFSILVTIPLTEPLSNSNELARNIARSFHSLGAGKLLAQRWGDLIRSRRSKSKNQQKYSLQPTLTDVTWGDIALAMPSRYVTDIVETIEALNKIMPGLANDSTILYGPEIKFHGLKITTDSNLKVADKIYVAGDGSGYTRGIVGAAASGILAADGILKSVSI